MSNLAKQNDELRDKLNRETSRIAWTELQRFFANGSVVSVSESLDLIDVGIQISNDNKGMLARWMELGLVAKASDEQAQHWLEADAVLWAMVVSPWILVQPVKASQMPSAESTTH
ncbi:MAG: DUF2288 domain-containing protein [Pseudomonadota bacterium]